MGALDDRAPPYFKFKFAPALVGIKFSAQRPAPVSTLAALMGGRGGGALQTNKTFDKDLI